MIKTISIDQDKLGSPVMQLIKLSSRGLIGDDRRLFAKRAGESLIGAFDHIKFRPGEVPVHMFAMGTTETVGPNRNGDGFKRASLQRYHDTFVKFAKFYREHLNNNPKLSYGVVKASALNEAMGRVELICALNESKEAAEHNVGFIADQELHKLASGAPLGVSMSCSVSHDVCSYCGNKAASRAHYCDGPEFGGTCKAGGLRRNIGKILSDGHHLHADNPEPRFFDISHVGRPADRIAYVTGRLSKAAAVERWSPDAYDILPPVAVICDGRLPKAATVKAANWLSSLANMEHDQPVTDEEAAQVCGSMKHAGVDLPPGTPVGEICRALVDANCVLSLAGFVQAFTGQNDKTASEIAGAVGSNVATAFSQLLSAGNVIDLLENNIYRADRSCSPGLRKWAQTLQDDFSLEPNYVRRRSMLNTIRNSAPRSWSGASLLKSASSQQLVQQFACYQVAALTDIFAQNTDLPLTSRPVVIQNRTSSPA